MHRIREDRVNNLSYVFLSLLFSSPALLGQLLPLQLYTSKDGLVSNSATTMVQDSKGYLWIGTYDGLSLFDGVAFKNYTTADGLPQNFVTCITESRRSPGTIWIGTLGGGVAAIRQREKQFGGQVSGKTITNHRLGENEAHQQVHALAEDHRGVLWCGTSDGLFQIEEGNVLPFDNLSQLGRVTGIAEMGDSLLWIISLNRGLVCLSSKDNRYAERSFPHLQRIAPRFFAKDPHGGLWIVDNDGNLTQLEGTTISKRIIFTDPMFRSQAILPDHDGNLWLGTMKGLIKVVPGKSSSLSFTRYTVEHGLPENQMFPATIDAEGNLWARSFSKGVVKLIDESLASFPLTPAPYVMNNTTVRVD
ncbi:MAG: ligand-binding sensor domain-containing protein, partial [Bacteroidota bacterium]